MIIEKIIYQGDYRMKPNNTIPYAPNKEMMDKYIEILYTRKPMYKDFYYTGFTYKYIQKRLIGFNRAFDRSSPREIRFLLDNYSYIMFWVLLAGKLPSVEVITSTILNLNENHRYIKVGELIKILKSEFEIKNHIFIYETCTLLKNLEVLENKNRLKIKKQALNKKEKELYLYYADMVKIDETLARKLLYQSKN